MTVSYPVYEKGDIDPGTFPELGPCLDIWEQKRGDRLAPRWDELDFLAFPTDLIPLMYLVDVIPESLDFRYRFVGTAMCDVEGYDYTGKSVDDMQPPEAAPDIRTMFEALYHDPKPTFFIVRMGDCDAGETNRIIYGGLRLPFSDDGQTMSQFLVIAHLGQSQYETKAYLETLIKEAPGEHVLSKPSTSKL